jgi:hypothetical protein
MTFSYSFEPTLSKISDEDIAPYDDNMPDLDGFAAVTEGV